MLDARRWSEGYGGVRCACLLFRRACCSCEALQTFFKLEDRPLAARDLEKAASESKLAALPAPAEATASLVLTAWPATCKQILEAAKAVAGDGNNNQMKRLAFRHNSAYLGIIQHAAVIGS